REVVPPGFVQTTPNPAPITLTAMPMDITGVGFGNFQPNSISGFKFNDLNDTGVEDPGEPGLAGGSIFLDLDGNGVLDPGEPSTVTDANGNFTFTGLAPGTYLVREVVPAGFVQTTPNPAPIIVTTGMNIMGVGFGNFQPNSISGFKFN